MLANLRRWGATIRRRGPARKYALDEAFFDCINTEEKAYWLGFLLADGCVQQTRAGNWTVRLELASRDKAHLVKLTAALRCDAPIRFGHHGRSVRLVACSRKLCQALCRLECFVRKTGKHGLPRISTTLLPHLFRGYFDGDGWLSKHKKSWILGIVGSPKFVLAFADWLENRLGFRPSFQRKRGLAWEIRYTGNRHVHAIVDLLYSDAEICLTRKHTRVKRLLAERAMMAVV